MGWDMRESIASKQHCREREENLDIRKLEIQTKIQFQNNTKNENKILDQVQICKNKDWKFTNIIWNLFRVVE